MPRPRDINSFTISGNLTADAELRVGGPCKIRIAWNRRTKKGDEWVDRPSYFTAVGWDETADAMADLKKGQHVIVSGRLEQNSWTGKDGVKKYDVNIIVDQVAPTLSSKEGEGKQDDDVPW